MRKSFFITGLVLSSWLSASPAIASDSLSVMNEDLPVNIQTTTVRTDFLKMKWVKIQLKNNNNSNIEKGIRLLNELKPIVSKVERNMKTYRIEE